MRVLLVDDEPFTLGVAYKFLSDAGFEVTTAGHVDEAIKLIEKKTFDVVITDILMPQRLGYELIHHVKALEKPIPVIAITGGFENAIADYVNQAELFADVALAKPLHRDNFIKTVQALI